MKKILILSIIIFNLGIAKSLDNNLTKNVTMSEIEQKNDRNLIMQEIESKRKKSLDELGEKIIDFYEMENGKNNYYTALYIFSKEATMDFKYTIENVSYMHCAEYLLICQNVLQWKDTGLVCQENR